MTTGSPTSLLERVQTTADAIRPGARARAFVQDIHAFNSAVLRIPDYPRPAFSEHAIDLLHVAADRVIAQIEERIDSERDSDRMKVRLAEDIYEIRRVLEQIDVWSRHGGAAPSARRVRRRYR